MIFIVFVKKVHVLQRIDLKRSKGLIPKSFLKYLENNVSLNKSNFTLVPLEE